MALISQAAAKDFVTTPKLSMEFYSSYIIYKVSYQIFWSSITPCGIHICCQAVHRENVDTLIRI